jgi:hypothetical protein
VSLARKGSSTGSLLLPARMDQADCPEENRQEPKRSCHQADEHVVPHLASDVARQIANGMVIQIAYSPTDQRRPTQYDECIGASRLPASAHGPPRDAGCTLRKATSSLLLTAQPDSCVPHSSARWDPIAPEAGCRSRFGGDLSNLHPGCRTRRMMCRLRLSPFVEEVKADAWSARAEEQA